jgi:hypothetical protein
MTTSRDEDLAPEHVEASSQCDSRPSVEGPEDRRGDPAGPLRAFFSSGWDRPRDGRQSRHPHQRLRRFARGAGAADRQPASRVPANDRPDDYRERHFERVRTSKGSGIPRPMWSTRFSGPSSASTSLRTGASAFASVAAATSTPASLTRTGLGTRSTTRRSPPCRTEVTRRFFPPESIGSRSSGRRRRGSLVIRDTGQEGAECSRQQLRQLGIDARSARKDLLTARWPVSFSESAWPPRLFRVDGFYRPTRIRMPASNARTAISGAGSTSAIMPASP